MTPIEAMSKVLRAMKVGTAYRVRQLAELTGLSKDVVHGAVVRLKNRGCVEYAGQVRNVKLWRRRSTISPKWRRWFS
jgi:DNA-binding IclR family transcriptional regulator